MGVYRHRILPWLIHLAMGNKRLTPYRQRLVSAARGTVLEIGIGSGRNLAFYGREVDRIIGLDPSPRLLDLARRAAERISIPVALLDASAESIPLADGSADTVVMAWTLCSIPDASRALAEARRVLKDAGRLLFVEHGLAPDAAVRRWQHRLDPFWWRVSCHLDRPMDRLIEAAGFTIEKLDAGYMAGGPKALTFMYEGEARRP